MTDALDRLTEVLRLARAKGADAADGAIADGGSVSIAVRKGALEKLERSEGAELGLRVFVA